jgi:hypothetical protein
MLFEQAHIGKRVRIRADHRSVPLRGLEGTVEKMLVGWCSLPFKSAPWVLQRWRSVWVASVCECSRERMRWQRRFQCKAPGAESHRS